MFICKSVHLLKMFISFKSSKVFIESSKHSRQPHWTQRSQGTAHRKNRHHMLHYIKQSYISIQSYSTQFNTGISWKGWGMILFPAFSVENTSRYKDRYPRMIFSVKANVAQFSDILRSVKKLNNIYHLVSVLVDQK